MSKKSSERTVPRETAFSADGTEVTVGLHVSDRERPGILVLILRVILAYCGTVGSVMTFVPVIYPHESAVPFALIAAAACLAACAADMMKRSGQFLIIGEYILYSAAFVKLRETAAVGFMRTANIYLSTVRMRYRDTDYFDISYYEGDIDGAVRTFLIMACILIAVTVSASVIYRTSFTCVFLVTFPPAELILYYGLVPDYFRFGMLICCWIGMAAAEFAEFPAAGIGNHLPIYKRVSSQAASAAALSLMICFCCSALFLELSGYERPGEFDDFKNRFSRYVHNFSWERFSNDIDILRSDKKHVSGAVSHGKLGRQDTVAFSDEAVLTVRLPKSSESVYLKSFTGVNYTGNSWLEENDEQKKRLDETVGRFETLAMTPERMDGFFQEEYSAYTGGSLASYDIEIIKMNDKDKFEYLPYNTVPGQNAVYRDGNARDLVTAVYNVGYRKRRSQAAGFIGGTISSGDLSDEFAHDEQLYRKYVYDVCLDVAEAFTAPDYIYQDTEVSDALTEADSIRGWLELNCTYDLSAGKLPFGEDFAQYFIVNTRHGSCTHFATAAALMCRYRGIPARYCEGYIIKPEDYPADAAVGDIVETKITDTRAHAWIEIYIDGMGWYPYEMTPGYGDVIDGTDESGDDLPAEEELTDFAEDETEIEAEEDPQEYEEEDESEETTEETEEEITEKNSGDESGSSAEPEARPAVPTVPAVPPETPETPETPFNPFPIAAAAVTAAVIGAVYLRYYIVISRRKRILSAGSPDEKAALSCRIFMRICGYKGIRKSRADSYEEFGICAGEKMPHINAEQALAVINAGLSAEFGRGGTDPDAAALSAEICGGLAEAVYRDLNFAGKLVFRYIYCLY